MTFPGPPTRYRLLGSRTQNGIQDGTLGQQFNPFLPGTGWDVVFTPDIWASNVTQFEIWQIFLDGPFGSSVQMFINGAPFNYINQGFSNYDDPVQPVVLNQTDVVSFAWNVPFTAPPYTTSNRRATVTCWIRLENAL